MDKLEILLATYSLPITTENPWGDFNRILAVTSRLKPTPDALIGVAPATLYFKVAHNSGHLVPMTESQFKDACVASVMQGVLPHYAELP